MRLDAAGRLIEIRAPKTANCTACDGCAERLSSAYQSRGLAYHHYRCHDDCPAGGTIIEHETGDHRRVGAVFRPPRTHCPTRRPDHSASVTHEPDRKSAEKSLKVNA